MTNSKSTSEPDDIDYYSIVSSVRPGRSPSIYHKEHRYYWSEFPQAPVYSIYNSTFHKVTPQAHTVDCRKYGQLHYWARIGDIYSPTLIVYEFTPSCSISKIKYFFLGGISVSDPSTGKMVTIEYPDKELFQYCLAGFSKEYLSKSYSFTEIK